MLKTKMFIIFLLISCTLTACFSYNDTNTTIFVTSLVVDVNEDQEIVVYAEAYHSYRSNLENAEEGQRLIYSDRGDSLFTTLRRLNEASRYNIDYTQCKVYVLTERAAQHGLGDILDLIKRNQETLIRSFITVFMGTPEEFFATDIRQDEFIGIYLNELFQDRRLSSMLPNYRLNDFLNDRTAGKSISKINALRVVNTSFEDFIRVDGVAILENDIMVEFMPSDEVMICNYLIDRIQSGSIEIEHPEKEDKILTLVIRRSETETDLYYENGVIHLTKTIDNEVFIADAQQGMEWNSEVIAQIENSAAEKIKSETETLFARYKEKGLDLFDIQHLVEQKYPGSDVENAIKITQLTSEVSVNVRGGGYVRGSR
ncbi:Ger(x)C family spore germination protein [Serpentinicella sp. ANB-PHB4]|uniref:Ger(x)C family spore germination protein n=1 Tax=Serpentinicella sp. ANB-PHB4 TaxID=3074076 RepID=UPI002858FE6C|nr:Ger(x)C family spore germination protein [Serpentinicella sp. ANB-PHB4]MDR5658640.1 Ger(x)C family spore germination protein [Serpentinicella sp. ANB-PHB4]